MEKRTKILLIVLVALIILGGGYYAYIIMTADETITAVAPPVATQTPMTPAAPKPEEGPKEAPAETPTEAAPAEQQTAKAEEKPEAAKIAQAQPAEKAEPQASAGQVKEAKPAAAEQAQPGAEKKAEAKPAPADQAKPGTEKKAEAKAVEGAAPCVATISAEVKGKKVEFKTPEEFLEKSGMDGKAAKEFSAANLEAAKKDVAGLEKAKAPAAQIDCAKKKLDLATRLAKLVEEKFPAKPEKEVYTYSSLDKRDPFMSPTEIPKVYPPVPKNAPPLERIPAEQVAVKGIIWNEKGFRALAIAPDGRGYTVKVGDTIGNKRGKIIRISEKRVYVEERIPDIFGDIEVRNIVLKLYKEAE